MVTAATIRAALNPNARPRPPRDDGQDHLLEAMRSDGPARSARAIVHYDADRFAAEWLARLEVRVRSRCFPMLGTIARAWRWYSAELMSLFAGENAHVVEVRAALVRLEATHPEAAIVAPASAAKGDTKEEGGRSAGVRATAPAPPTPTVTMPRVNDQNPGVPSVVASHPPLPTAGQPCLAGPYGVPTEINLANAPTAQTTGTRMSAADAAANIALARDVASRLQQGYLGLTRPLSAELLLHWLDGQGRTLIWPSSRIADRSVFVHESLDGDARLAFEAGARARLMNPRHQQGSLLPLGTVRFMQWQGRGRCLTSGGRYGLHSPGADLGLSLGFYYAHSIVWVRASAVRNTWRVEFLRWCVQVYDIIDFNAGALQIYPVPEAAYRDYLARLGRSSPPPAVTVVTRLPGLLLLSVNDDWFRDIEVSSAARKFLLYCDPFPAPAAVTGDMVIPMP